MRYIFDSSFLLSLHLLEDVNHEKAVEIFASLPEDAVFYMNELTYVELLTVMTYKKWFKFVRNMRDFISDSNTFFVNSGNFEYIRYFEALSKKISVVDVSILYDALKYDCEILSFDKEILRLGK